MFETAYQMYDYYCRLRDEAFQFLGDPTLETEEVRATYHMARILADDYEALLMILSM